ncbi:MAG: HAMP domain-containing sensor histidine kinase [Gammaproteobacteria bacterium]|nr:HAMP domain-containing sensor histidine kinase [Gammaproteobacteria bacterium]MDP6734462.1 HAMP domain-containing sensor histidine kinase [Gammaproteobacteria bacterium]
MREYTPRTRRRLRRYLVSWIAGCTLLMVVAYTQLLDYYFELGVDLRTQSLLERTAQDFAADTSRDLPTGPGLAAYTHLTDIPAQFHHVFDLDDLDHGKLERHVNQDLDGDDDLVPIDTADICPEGPCELLFLYPYKIEQDQWLYLVQGIVGSDAIYKEMRLTEQIAIGVGATFIVLFFLGSFLVIRSVHGPLRKLENWSATLSTDKPNRQVPELRYEELNSLANRLNYAFERMHESVEKEKLFLRHASHELRTPLAILASNVELLDKLSDRPERSDAEQAAFSRQYQALDDVRLLIETLLWVNRQSDSLPKQETLALRSELSGVVKNYSQLLDGRAVSLTIEGEDEVIEAPAAAVRIVLSNLVRNAFQYTLEGAICIELAPGRISIENTNVVESAAEESLSIDENGFGLGLELVDRICQRFDWHYSTQELPQGRITVVQFSKN